MTALPKSSHATRQRIANPARRALPADVISLGLASRDRFEGLDRAGGGASWKLVALPGHRVTSTGIREAHLVPTRASGRVAGFAGCNRLITSCEMQGSMIRFRSSAATRMACEENMDQERVFMKALDAATASRIDGDRLQVPDGNRTVLAAFTSGFVRFGCDDGQSRPDPRRRRQPATGMDGNWRKHL